MKRLAILAVLALSTAGSGWAQTPDSAKAGDEEAGRDAYGTECRACHGGGAIAPSLRGVVGRPIAGDTAFDNYTDALKSKHDQIWTEASLDAFLKSPPDFAPGTHMAKAVPDDQARADLIAYLKSLSPAK